MIYQITFAYYYISDTELTLQQRESSTTAGAALAGAASNLLPSLLLTLLQ